MRWKLRCNPPHTMQSKERLDAIRNSRNYGRTGYTYPNDPRRQYANECFEQSIINNLPSTNVAFPIHYTMQLKGPLYESQHGLHPLMTVYCSFF